MLEMVKEAHSRRQGFSSSRWVCCRRVGSSPAAHTFSQAWEGFNGGGPWPGGGGQHGNWKNPLQKNGGNKRVDPPVHQKLAVTQPKNQIRIFNFHPDPMFVPLQAVSLPLWPTNQHLEVLWRDFLKVDRGGGVHQASHHHFSGQRAADPAGSVELK